MKVKLCLLLLIFYSFKVLPAPLQVLTEHLPPMQIVKDNRVVDGMAVELVQALLDEAGESARIQAYNWARAYKIATSEENVLIFSMARYPSREAQFKWVGEIYTLTNYLWRLKSRKDIKVTSFNDAKAYSIAAIRNDVQHLHLENLGFKSPEHLLLTSNLEQALELLFRQRVELFAASATLMPTYLQNTQYKMSDLEPLLKIEAQMGTLFIAFSNKTDDRQVARFRKAYQALKQKGIYQSIVAKWVKHLNLKSYPLAQVDK